MIIFLIIVIIISSLDTFITGIVLGINNIKLKIKEIILINIIICLLLSITYLIKDLIINYINIKQLKTIISLLFITLGLNKIRKLNNNSNININNLSIKEIIILIISLSIDNLLICFSINNYFYLFILLHFIINIFLLYISNYFSYKLLIFNQRYSDILSIILFFFLAIFNLFY